MSKMPEKLLKFLDLTNEQLYYISGKIVIFDEPDLVRLGFSAADIENIIYHLSEKKIVSRSRVLAVKAELVPPAEPDRRRRHFWFLAPAFVGPSDDGDAKSRYVIELVSREEFYAFHEQSKEVKKEIPQRNIELSFDIESSELSFMGSKILISKKNDKTNSHYVLDYIFKNPDGIGAKSYYSDIYESVGDKAVPYSWRRYHRACSSIQEKIRKNTSEKIDDFLIIKTGESGWVQINNKYLASP